MNEPPRTVSRRGFMALAGGSVAAASALAACGGESSARAETADFGDGDAGIINYLLTIEYLLADFYTELSSSPLFTPAAQKGLGKFGTQEEEHAEALVKQLEKIGGKQGSRPQSSFSFETEEGTLEIGAELENAAAAAYLGQLPNIEDERVRSKVLEIHSVEGRHAAALDYLLERDMTPDGTFAKPSSVKTVMAVMKPYMTETASV